MYLHKNKRLQSDCCGRNRVAPYRLANHFLIQSDLKNQCADTKEKRQSYLFTLTKPAYHRGATYLNKNKMRREMTRPYMPRNETRKVLFILFTGPMEFKRIYSPI